MSSSPRSSALSRASSLKGPRSSVSDLTYRLESNIRPVLMLAAVVAAVVIAWMVGGSYEEVAAELHWADVLQNGTLAGVCLLGVLGVTAYVTAHAFMHADHTARMVMLALFVGIAVVLGIAAYLFFCRTGSDRKVAFYLVVAVVLAVLVHTYFVWRATDLWHACGMIPAVALGALLLWKFWPEDLF